MQSVIDLDTRARTHRGAGLLVQSVCASASQCVPVLQDTTYS